MLKSPPRPLWIPPGSPPSFPDVRSFDKRGLIAGGGDLSPGRLLAAYRAGIFPWFDEPPILWWSPDPRAILNRSTLHVSRSLRAHLRKSARSGELKVSATPRIREVMQACAERSEGSWINAPMLDAYERLAELGHAWAYAVHRNGLLVGGLYGVSVGALFAAESMFHRETNASKVALVCAITHLFQQGFRVCDVQFRTGHLERMGALEVSRATYLAEVTSATRLSIDPHFPGPYAHDLLPWVVENLELE